MIEIIKHSGPARLGKLHYGKHEIQTPNFFLIPSKGINASHEIYLAPPNSDVAKKPVIYDYGSLKTKRDIKEFGILPDEHVGLRVPRSIAESSVRNTIQFANNYSDYGAVIQGSKYVDLREKCAEAFKERPLLAVADGRKLIENPKLLVEIVTRVREVISPNSALYFPFAPPHLFYLLAYMGIDLFDSAECIFKARENRILTPRGYLDLEPLKELPCTCAICTDKTPGELINDFSKICMHNLNIARQIVREIREAIKSNKLRELAEEKAACDVRAMVILRLLDKKQDFLERYTPVSPREVSKISFITFESLQRPEVKRWHRRIKERYTPPRGIKLSIILPCSAKKPYSASRSHVQFRRYIRKGARKKLSLVHEIILTSPLGVVPRELEGVFPAAHYDVPVTGHWIQEEKDITVELLSTYMKEAKTKMLAHVDGVYREICKALDIELTKEHILSKGSLADLEQKIYNSLKDFTSERKDTLDSLRKVCDFQFGKGAGECLIPANTYVKGYQIFLKEEQIATVNPKSGTLALNLLGGRLLKKYGKHLVEISFRPDTNSIFCAGVENADEGIRPGDEVAVIYRDEVVGVGRAVLNGGEMIRAKKGLAVELRHRA